jgi:thiol:disulfide interchange protein DsbD
MNCWGAAAIATLVLAPWLAGQGSGVLTASAERPVAVKRGGAAQARIRVQLRGGYHVNSHAPEEDYLIPLALRWDDGGPLKAVEVTYPKPELRKYRFSEKPLSVFTGEFFILTEVRASADAPTGSGVLLGKLRYQACDEDSCLPPRTVEVRLPYEIR